MNRFVEKDTVEAIAWMKDDKGKPIFEMSLTKARRSVGAGEKMRVAWTVDAKPAVALSPELKVLDRLAGTWDVTSLSKKAGWTPEEQLLRAVANGGSASASVKIPTCQVHRAQHSDFG